MTGAWEVNGELGLPQARGGGCTLSRPAIVCAMATFPAPVHIAPGVACGGPAPVLICGPCQIESRAHALALAKRLHRLAATVGFPLIFKASFDKANRTSLAGPRGVGIDAGLDILAEIRDRLDVPVTTDVHECWQVERAAAIVDLIQVPAFLCRQTDLICACAASGAATSIKKGQFLSPNECASLVAKFGSAGGQRLILIERGTSFGYQNLVVDMRSLPILRSLGVPVVFDATHSVQTPGGLGDRSGGAGHFAPVLARAAMAAGIDGIFIETHENPAASPSDGPNMIPLKELPVILRQLAAIRSAVGRPTIPPALADQP